MEQIQLQNQLILHYHHTNRKKRVYHSHFSFFATVFLETILCFVVHTSAWELLKTHDRKFNEADTIPLSNKNRKNTINSNYFHRLVMIPCALCIVSLQHNFPSDGAHRWNNAFLFMIRIVDPVTCLLFLICSCLLSLYWLVKTTLQFILFKTIAVLPHWLSESLDFFNLCMLLILFNFSIFFMMLLVASFELTLLYGCLQLKSY